MKVLQVLDYYRPYGSGGAEWSVLSLAEGLQGVGVDISTLAPDWGTPEAQDSYGSFIRFFMPVRPKKDGLIVPFWLSSPLFWLYSMLAILVSIARLRPDVVHIHGKYMIPGGILAGLLSRQKTLVTVRDYVPLCPYALCLFDKNTRHKNVKEFFWKEMPKYQRLYGQRNIFNYLFTWISGMWGYIYAAVLRWCLHRVSRVVYLSNMQAAIYQKSGYPKGSVIGNRCVVSSHYSSLKNLSDTVLYAGKVSYGKGVDLLLAAWEDIHVKHPTWRLVLCGEGQLLNRALDKGIVVKGGVTHEELVREYQRAMFTIVPSVWPEPFGRVVIESVLSGTPVLVTKHVGTAHFVKLYKVGWVVSPSAKSLGQGIEQAMKEATQMHHSILYKRGKLAARWDKTIIDAHVDLYRSLL